MVINSTRKGTSVDGPNLKLWETIPCWYSQRNHHSRVSWVMQIVCVPRASLQKVNCTLTTHRIAHWYLSNQGPWWLSCFVSPLNQPENRYPRKTRPLLQFHFALRQRGAFRQFFGAWPPRFPPYGSKAMISCMSGQHLAMLASNWAIGFAKPIYTFIMLLITSTFNGFWALLK